MDMQLFPSLIWLSQNVRQMMEGMMVDDRSCDRSWSRCVPGH